jgi:hypothetical protein
MLRMGSHAGVAMYLREDDQEKVYVGWYYLSNARPLSTEFFMTSIAISGSVTFMTGIPMRNPCILKPNNFREVETSSV